MGVGRVMALCQFGGEFCTLPSGSEICCGGEAHTIDIDQHILYEDLRSEIASMFNIEVKHMAVKCFVPGRLPIFVMISDDKDLKHMIAKNASSGMVNIAICRKPLENTWTSSNVLPLFPSAVTDEKKDGQRKRSASEMSNNSTYPTTPGNKSTTDTADETSSRIVALCQLGGELCTLADGSICYYGGKAHMIDIHRDILYDDLKSELTSQLNIDVSTIAIKYLLADNYQAFMIISRDRDLNHMIELNSRWGTVNILILDKLDNSILVADSSTSTRMTVTENEIVEKVNQGVTNANSNRSEKVNMIANINDFKDRQIEAICQFGGEFFTLSNGLMMYCGGEARLMHIDRHISYQDLKLKIVAMFQSNVSLMAIKCSLPGSMPTFLSISCDKNLKWAMTLNAKSRIISIAIRYMPHCRASRSLLPLPPSTMMADTDTQNVCQQEKNGSDSYKWSKNVCLANSTLPGAGIIAKTVAKTHLGSVALCQFGGKFHVLDDGSLAYSGGKAYVIDIDHNTSFNDLRSILTNQLNLDFTAMAVKCFPPHHKWACITVSCDRDLDRTVAVNASSGTVNIAILNEADYRSAVADYGTSHMVMISDNQNVSQHKEMVASMSNLRSRSNFHLSNRSRTKISMMVDISAKRNRIVALCQFGGKFCTLDNGSLMYCGGKAHAIDINRNVLYDDLRTEITSTLKIDIAAMAIKYFALNLNWAFMVVSCDRDLNRAIAVNASEGMITIVILNESEYRTLVTDFGTSHMITITDNQNAKQHKGLMVDTSNDRPSGQ